MKQIVDKLNKIAKKIDESVEIPQTDLIIDSLDAITKAYGGTPNDSNLIVDKLEDIYNNIGSGGGGGGDSDFTTAQLTIVGEHPEQHLPIVTVVPDYGVEGSTGTTSLGSGSPYTVILYKGKCYAPFDHVTDTSGDITFDNTLGLYVITGDCSVTFEIL